MVFTLPHKTKAKLNILLTHNFIIDHTNIHAVLSNIPNIFHMSLPWIIFNT